MWLILAFLSAALLGFYDSFKKKSLQGNAVIPVLFLNTVFSSLIFLPFIILSATGTSLDHTPFHVASGGWEIHKYIILKSAIVLSSWTFGYFGMKHLPLTIVGPINATRPVMVLVGALLVFGEKLNVWQWIVVCCSPYCRSSCSAGRARKRASTSSTTAGLDSSYWLPCWEP
jgi:drug/metabolite transporter (DMT)-like permease